MTARRYATSALCFVALMVAARAFAQEAPSATIEQDCSQFAIAPDNTIAYSVSRIKDFQKILIERDELWLATPGGKTRKIIDPDKFMPTPPPSTYIVQGIYWSPDSQRLALAMLTKQYPWTPKVKGKKKGELDDDDIDNTYDDNTSSAASSSSGNAMALFDLNGEEIKVAGSKTRFIQGAISGTWLNDGKTFVYENGASQIVRVTPADGKTTNLYQELRFEGIAWDAPRNRAFAVGYNVTGRMTLFELGLLQETIRDVTQLPAYKNSLTVSHAGTAIGYYSDGDTIEVLSLADPAKTKSVRTGPGRFEFAGDDRRILVKRGPLDQSNDLVWVRFSDGDFSPILHDLVYHDFHIAPDGRSVGVVDVGRGLLRIYPLEN
jgi:hypothetical protein